MQHVHRVCKNNVGSELQCSIEHQSHFKGSLRFYVRERAGRGFAVIIVK
jgi:hypothetical protein